MNTDTITSPTADAERLRDALVDRLRADGQARTPAKGGHVTTLDVDDDLVEGARTRLADDVRRVVPLSADGTVRLQAPAGLSIDAEALAGVLDEPRTEEWTGMKVRAMESPEWMELFLTRTLPSRLIRMLFPWSAKGTLLSEAPYPSSTAVVDRDAAGYLARHLTARQQ